MSLNKDKYKYWQGFGKIDTLTLEVGMHAAALENSLILSQNTEHVTNDSAISCLWHGHPKEINIFTSFRNTDPKFIMNIHTALSVTAKQKQAECLSTNKCGIIYSMESYSAIKRSKCKYKRKPVTMAHVLDGSIV
jgi:hypothetical protein